MASRRRRRPAAELTAIEQWFDAIVRHQIGLLSVAAGIGNKVQALLDATEDDMRSKVRIRLRGRTGIETPAQVARMERLIEELERIRSTAWDNADEIMVAEMRAIAVAEPKFLDGILKTTMPVTLETRLPTARQLRALVTTLPFEGQNLKGHLERIRSSDLRRIAAEVRIGMVQAETLPQISRRLVGSARLRGRQGTVAITRKQAHTLARTAVSAYANAATRAWALENSDIFSVDLFVATLDDRTTEICGRLDGRTFPTEQVYPQLPIHFGERSRRVPMPDAEAIGSRPMKPFTRKQLLREFAAREGLDKVPLTRKQLPLGTKGKFDEFARQRVRELTGRVPAKVSFREFFGRQSAAFQDDYLGQIKGWLYRRGGLEFEAFVDLQGNVYTIPELAQRHRRAFIAAGLDPEEFL